MDAAARRRAIAAALEKADGPVPASVLGERCGVSRQIIVGDIALLRAAGAEITATLAAMSPGAARPRGSGAPPPAYTASRAWSASSI